MADPRDTVRWTIDAAQQAYPSGRLLFRAMQADPDGKPKVGPTARTLGVRPGLDIGMAREDAWLTPDPRHPKGLSVAPDNPAHLLVHRRPAWLPGGEGKDPLFVTTVEAIESLVPQLRFYQDAPGHGVLAPAIAMSLADLQRALSATRIAWALVPAPPLRRRKDDGAMIVRRCRPSTTDRG